jgi:F0F1-type ATP synthase membrane subunit b/b'
MSSLYTTISLLPQVAWDTDDKGVTSDGAILPPIGEIVLQTIATAIIFGLLFKFAGPAIKKYYADRTVRIQRELDEAAAAKESAVGDAAQIRASLGDIAAEKARMQAEADAAAAALLSEGRARIVAEVAELEARATAEIAGLASGSGDELRGEISRLSGRAIDLVVAESITESNHQQLIEDFIAQVGASGGPGSTGATS